MSRCSQGLQNDGGVNILFTGRFSVHKRIDRIMEVASIYKRAVGKKVTVHLAGKITDDDSFSQLISKTREFGMLTNIKFYINCPLIQLKTLMAACDVFLCVSEHEGFMVPIVEAFAAGCPVVAVDTTAVGETMGDAGLLVKMPDPFVIAGLIEMLRTDRQLRGEVIAGQAARALDFSPRVTGRRWLQFLEQVVAGV